MKRSIDFFIDQNKWKYPLIFIFFISIVGVGLIGIQTYQDAPPLTDYTNKNSTVIIKKENILNGQKLFHKLSLMEFGSLFGDGAQRGPDFTAQSVHMISQFLSSELNTKAKESLQKKVQKQLKTNTYNKEKNVIVLSHEMTNVVVKLRNFYVDYFKLGQGKKAIFEKDIKLSQLNDLADFFFWSAWVSLTERPGEKYSYTHNWPYDKAAGNTPTTESIFWSFIGLLGFVLGCGIVLYYLGQYNQLPNSMFKAPSKSLMTLEKVANYKVTESQRATYKYFLVAVLLFLSQILAGFLTLDDFINFSSYLGIKDFDIPISIARSCHLMLALFWISACWIASSIFILPIIAKQEVAGQKKRVNRLFTLIVLMVVGSLFGLIFGPQGIFGDNWYWFGYQGWEYVDFGRVYQIMLMLVFIYWAFIIYKGIKPAFKKGNPWKIPNWIMYSVIGIPLLFISGFVAGPETNFVIADFWRWMVVHMWVEAFFEVFITVIISYLMVLMGLVNEQAATRVIFFATILFLGTGLLGISHNFYWNAKPVETMALGSVFSTLQFIPLILLTIEAWRFKSMPKIAMIEHEHESLDNFGFNEVFLFLIAVNFWNFFGAGVMGIIINLPIMNYFEHGTYLTINHGHAAFMGVYGNISLAALIFACKLMTPVESWNEKAIKTIFWSINIGLLLMVILDLLPAGLIQLKSVIENGLWYARSEHFIEGDVFKSLTWLRGIGASLFLFGGVIPLTVYFAKRMRKVKI